MASFIDIKKNHSTTYRGKSVSWSNGRQMMNYNGTEFTYDGLGRRLSKGDIKYTYDSGNRVIKQSNGIEFIYDNSGVAGIVYNAATYLYRKDAQGNIVALIDNNGKVVVEYKYDAWGNHAALYWNKVNEKEQYSEVDVAAFDENYAQNKTLAELNPFRYRGYYYDTETGLYYLKSRYYDPETGRFITIDDISYIDPETINGLNLYAYCGNNPVMRVDENGNAWWHWLAGIFAVIGVALVIAAITVVTCGVGALAGTFAGAVIYGAAQGVIIGGSVGVVAGGLIGGAVSGWTAEGILTGMGIGLGAGAIIGGVIGGFAGASSFTANSTFITQNGGNVKEVLKAFKGNPKLKTLKADTTVFRSWGGSSPKYSHWVSTKNYGINARKMLALPPSNTMANTSTFIMPKGSIVLQGKVAAMFGQSGGGLQWWVALLS